MLRRISTKLVLAVLAAVALPFVAFAWFVDDQVGQELSLKVVRETLKGVAATLSVQVDGLIAERTEDLTGWSDDLIIRRASDPTGGGKWGPEYTIAVSAGKIDRDFTSYNSLLRLQTGEFDRNVEIEQVYDYLLLIGTDGRLMTCNSTDAEGQAVDPDVIRNLYTKDYAQEDWFRRVLMGEFARVDWHVSPFLPVELTADRADPGSYHIGFAAPIYSEQRTEEVVGVIYALVNWRHIQALISVPEIKDYFRGLVTPEKEPSPYAWIWGSDADTIQAHEKHDLYGKKVSGDPVNLPQMVEDALSQTSGLYREYTFQGIKKNAAFKICEEEMGTQRGWVVGVGIDNVDIFAKEESMTAMLIKATVVVLLVVVLWTMIIARRTTSPILALQEHTSRVAAGDLDTRIEIKNRDELGELAYAFNQMTRELSDQRVQLVKAEKDAAWREMARQIAHDIKNPLTPIKLSLDLLDRARRDGAEDLETILDRVSELMHRQVDNLREIATDFYEFTGGRKADPEPFEISAVVDELFQLHGAWAAESGVELERLGNDAVVYADRYKVRRVLTNLLSNALQAMHDGGRLEVELSAADARVVLEIRDTGRGIDPDVREHLFEPYFTTRSEGTGLGLAIAKRAVEEMAGTIELGPRDDGPGTVARVTLPRHQPRG